MDAWEHKQLPVVSISRRRRHHWFFFGFHALFSRCVQSSKAFLPCLPGRSMSSICSLATTSSCRLPIVDLKSGGDSFPDSFDFRFSLNEPLLVSFNPVSFSFIRSLLICRFNWSELELKVGDGFFIYRSLSIWFNIFLSFPPFDDPPISQTRSRTRDVIET